LRVSVLGAGPAGSTAAYYLAKAGIDVELIDRVNFPRDKPCAGGLFNPQLYLKQFPHLESEKGFYVYKVKFSCGKYSAEYSSPKPLLMDILRKEFDYSLLQKATDVGAIFQRGTPADGDVVIDATGARRKNNYTRSGIGLAMDFKLKEKIDTVHIHYGFGGIFGYCWLYPKKGYVNIGIGAYLPQKNINKIYASYIDFLQNAGVVSLDNKHFKAKLLPFAPTGRYSSGKTLFVGDAAGFVRPGTGEGIYFAMLSGKIAALTIIEKKPFSWYEDRCREEFGKYLKLRIPILNRSLINKILEKAVRIFTKDELFLKMWAEDFFRLEYHNIGTPFLKNIFK
jgi:flavin-dependent dehydrogenase